MQIDQRLIDGVMVIIPREERLDAAVAGAFKGFMIDAINQGSKKVVLDLGKVEFVDSSGLTAIVSAMKSLGLAGGEMVVCSINKNLAALFKLTRLDRVFKIFDSQDLACQSLQN